MKEQNQYLKMGNDYTERLAKLNKSVWDSCREILQDGKSYEAKMPKDEIEVFITLLEQSYKESDFRKFDTLMELIDANYLLAPIRHLTMQSTKKLEEVTNDPIRYYKIHEQLINDEKP